jgi:hypothetical protein
VNTTTDNNPRTAGQASSAWQTFKDRDDWIRLFLATDGEELSCTAKIVGARIALHHNIETGRCDPSLGELAHGTGMSDRNVRRMLRELEEKCWVRVQSRGHHRSNSFELLVPEAVTRPDESQEDRTTVSGQNGPRPDTVVRSENPRPDTAVRPENPRPDNPGRLTGQSGSVRPDTVVRQKRESNSEENSEERESLELDLGDEEGRRRDQTPPDTDSFEAWWRQYPRKEDKTDAKKAYRAVRKKKLATAAELLAGAMRYAAERQRAAEIEGSDKAYRYTKFPATWLRAGSWANEPAAPTTSTIDPNGTVVSTPPPPNRQWPSESWDEAAFAGMRRGQP